MMFYHLATPDRTLPVAQKLMAAGDPIGIQDAAQNDALAYALRSGNLAIAARLLQLGARPDALVGPNRLPNA